MHGGSPRPRRVEEPVRQQAVAYLFAVATWCFGLGATAVLIEALVLGVDAGRATSIAALTVPGAAAFVLKRLWLPDRVDRGPRFWLFGVAGAALAFFGVMWMFRALGRML